MTPAKAKSIARWRAANRALIRKRSYKYRRDYKTKYPGASGAASRRYRAKPESQVKLRDYSYKRLYGISLDQYEELLEAQNGVCKVCKQPERRRVTRGRMCLAVDHDHTTKVVRGLLCRDCNVAVGLLEESPDRMRNLASYIEEAKKAVV